MKAFYYDMEPYRMQVSGKDLLVLPMADGVYRVCYRNRLLADLYPEISAGGIYWNGFGLISSVLAQEIGMKICAFESSSLIVNHLGS